MPNTSRAPFMCVLTWCGLWYAVTLVTLPVSSSKCSKGIIVSGRVHLRRTYQAKTKVTILGTKEELTALIDQAWQEQKEDVAVVFSLGICLGLRPDDSQTSSSSSSASSSDSSSEEDLSNESTDEFDLDSSDDDFPQPNR
jgi:hypothetical protein